MADDLTVAQAKLLLAIEQWPIAQRGATEASYRRDLAALEDAGLVAGTRGHWRITAAGRRRLAPRGGV